MDLEKQVKEICEQVYNKQPQKYKRFLSLSNFIFYLEFSESEKYVLKIFNLEADNIFLFDEKENEKYLKKGDFYNSLIYKETPTWRIENYIEGETLSVEHHQSQRKRKMYMKRLNEFHKLASKQGMEHHLLNRLWEYKPKIYGKIRQNLANHSDKDKVEAVLQHFDDFYNNIFKKYETDEKLVFVHNDLLYGNWIYNSNSKKIQLIDYEYCGFGFFMTDIYNILIESTYEYRDDVELGYTKTEEVMPSPNEIRELIRYYLFFDKYGDEFYSKNDKLDQLNEMETDPRFKEINNDIIESYYEKINFYGAICDMYWSLWAFYIYHKPGVKLQYVPYAFDRYHDFCKKITDLENKTQ